MIGGPALAKPFVAPVVFERQFKWAQAYAEANRQARVQAALLELEQAKTKPD